MADTRNDMADEGGRRHRASPRPVSALIPGLTRAAFRVRSPAAALVIADWEAIAGPAIAAVTAPRRLSGEVLTIACAGPVALELQHMAEALVGRINLYLGRKAVSRLRLVQESLPPPRPPPAPLRAPDPSVREAAEARLADLPPGELRDALAALGATILTARR